MMPDNPTPLDETLPARPVNLADLARAARDFVETANLDPTATMRARPARLAPGDTPPAERELAFWVPEAQSLPALSIGQEDAELKITGLLGEGGTGQVLLAEQRSMGREVAVKVPRLSEPWLAATLLAEGRLAGRVEHPNVVPIYALGRRDDGAPILVMKRVRGESWETLLREPDHPFWERFGLHGDRADRADWIDRNLRIFLAVTDGIAAAHRAGIVHRDIKPANVLVAGPDEVLVIDWGLATDQTAPAETKPLVGTPAFMAPEMLDPRAMTDPRVDIYELGATLHYALTGRHRNFGATTAAILKHLAAETEPELREVPPGLAAIVRRATAFDPADRYATASELASELRQWLDERAAERLVARADDRMDELAVLVATKPRDPETERAAAACRASVEDALQLAPEHDPARAASQRYFELWVGHLLDSDALEAARSELWPTRPSPLTAPDALVARFEALSAGARERRERLDTLERDLDLRPAARARRNFFLVGTLYSVCAFVITLGILPRVIPDYRSQVHPPILTSVATNLAFWGGVLTFRHLLLHNAASRRIIAWLGTLLGSILIHRLVAIGLRGSDVFEVMTYDSLLVTALSGFAAFVLSRRFWPGPLIALTAFLVGVFVPLLSPHAFGVAMIGNLYLGARVWGDARDPTGGDAIGSGDTRPHARPSIVRPRKAGTGGAAAS